MIRHVARAALCASVLTSLACSADKFNVPQYNAPTVTGVNGTAQALQLYVSGVLLQERNNIGGYNNDVGIFGRESYSYFPTDARSVSHYLIGLPGPNNTRILDPAGFASGQWAQWYRNMRNAVNLVGFADGTAALTAQQKSGVKGFAKTMRALSLYRVIVTRDTLGASVDIPPDAATPTAFVSRDAAWQAVSGFLDDAKTDLTAAGSSFAFALDDGFAVGPGFNTPATFLKFNRALAARVLVNRASLGCTACWAQALQALNESFITAPTSVSDLNIGVYNVFSSTPGDALTAQNISVTPTWFAHASALTDAQTKPSGDPDDRVTRKVAVLSPSKAAPGTNNGIPATAYFIMYPTNVSPVPIIRNEELLHLRAEVNMQSGNPAAALADINAVRTVSGGLAALGSLGADPVGTLLYERRYSLLWEGHRWNDMRRYNRLNQLPLDCTGNTCGGTVHFVAKVMPVPKQECDARGAAAPGC
jgi:hypothetical protein